MILRNQALLAVGVQPSFSVPEEVVDGITLSCKVLTFTAVEQHNEAITPVERQLGGKPAADDECLGRKQTMTRILFLRSEEHTSELQSLMRNSYAVISLKKK